MKKYFVSAGVVAVVGLAILGFTARHGRAPRSAPVAAQSYVALGDSVAAGVGLKTDSDSSACDRTNESYPNQVANILHYKLTNVACSGATLPAGILGKQDVNELLVAPQLSQLFARPKPALVSLTIGANDAGWTNIIASCYTGECGSAADTAAVNAQLNIMSANLRTALADIQNHYGRSAPKVVVTGYHQVFPTNTSASCTDLTGIDASELAWGRQMQQALNTAISTAAGGYSFATFVPVNFSGHELCTVDSWVQGLADKDPYHPTQAGQTAFAQQITQALKAHK